MSVFSEKIPVKPADLRGELERIRRDAAELDVKREELFSDDVKPRVRTTLANVVLLLGKNTKISDSELEDLITELCVSYPSRFFIIRCADSVDQKSSSLQTSVSSRCVFAKSGMHVCSEEVYVRVEDKTQAELVPNVLLSLMEPDIESVLVLLCNPTGQADHFDDLLDRLSSVSDLLVVDSALYEPFLSGNLLAIRAADIPPASGFNPTVLRDLNWLRRSQWRQLIAEHFETFLGQGGSLSLDELVLRGTSESLSPGSDLLLLLGWVFSCLDLRVEKAVERKDDNSYQLEIKCRDFRNRLAVSQVLLETGDRSCRDSLRAVQMTVSYSSVELSKMTMRLELSKTSSADCIEVSSVVCVEKQLEENDCNNALRRVSCSEQGVDSLLVNLMGAHADNCEYSSVIDKLKEVFNKLSSAE